MAAIRKKHIVLLCLALACVAGLTLFFSKPAKSGRAGMSLADVLTDSISRIVSACPGEVGVALIVNNSDTVTVKHLSDDERVQASSGIGYLQPV